MQNINPYKTISLKNLKSDLPAGLIVFLVAVPLCLGIALASGTSMFSGLIAGIIGGIVVGILSDSHVGVSGPAAGLVVIVINAISDLGSFNSFLLALVFAGIFQIILGIIKAGVISYYFPSSVIKGMLTSIGLIIFLKQIPHAFGYDKDYEGDLAFFQPDGYNTFSELLHLSGNYISYGATVVSLVSIIILILWESKFIKRYKLTQIIQGPLVVVIVGIILNNVFKNISLLAISEEHLVNIPVFRSYADLQAELAFPDFSSITNPQIYLVAFTLAVVASLETLLCLEATEKLDPYKRMASPNKELIAQGVGNTLSGLIGGLPITQVIVRSSTNIMAGGKTKMAAIIHGIFLVLAVFLIPGIIRQIPLASLAAILFLVGYKLAHPNNFKEMYNLGHKQFVPFIITVISIMFTDLLIGILIGLGFSILYILYSHYKNPYSIKVKKNKDKNEYIIKLSEIVSFLHKAGIRNALAKIPPKSHVIIDARKTHTIDNDVIDVLMDFRINSLLKHIDVEILGLQKTIVHQAIEDWKREQGDKKKK